MKSSTQPVHRPMFTRLREHEGMALLVVMLALLILSLTGIAMSRIASTELELTGHYRAANQAFFAADGGAEYGLNELLDLGRTLARHPTAAELAGIAVPPLPDTNFTTFAVNAAGAAVTQPLTSGFFQGLVASSRPYIVTTTAETVSVPRGSSTVEMMASFDIIPIFQFAIFYEFDLEVTPGPDMDIDGRVHSNADIYIDIDQTMNIRSQVTAAGDIWNYRHDGSTYGGTERIRDGAGNMVSMNGLDSNDADWETNALDRWDGNIRSVDHGIERLNVTIADPTDPHMLIRGPEVGDGADEQDAKLYYAADLRIINGDGYDSNGNAVSLIDPVSGTSVIEQTIIFDQREQKHQLATEVDMAKLNNLPGWPANGLLYVGGFEPGGPLPNWTNPPWQQGGGFTPPWANGGTESDFAVKLKNGSELAAPLTVVSENPVYIRGDYNTINKKGAAVMGDVITILSNRWGDMDNNGTVESSDLDYSTWSYNNRHAASAGTTINAAVMVGNIASGGGNYSGGVHNAMRFMERWTNDWFHYRGSIIDLWRPVVHTSGTIVGNPVYAPPNRDISFDTDFLDPANLPPFTPNVYTIRVLGWDRSQ